MLFSDFVHINPKTDLKKGEVYSFIEMEDVTPSNRYIRPVKQKQYKGGGCKYQSKDILFARITPCLENGKIAQVKINDEEIGFGSTEFFVFRSKNGISDDGYLFYLAYSDILRKPAEKSMYGASGRQRAALDTIKSVNVPDISLTNQRIVSSILSTYDDLIENNTRRITILEEMAQLIYREWFVNFRFPGFKKVKFVDSELGKIPEGWQVKSFFDMRGIRFISGNIPQYKGVKQYFATADVNGIDFVKEGIEYIYSNKPSRAQKQPILNSVWFARMKDTYKVLVFSNQNVDFVNSIMLSSGFAGFEAFSENWLSFLFVSIKSADFHQQKDLYCTGATQMSLTNDGLARIKWLFPKESIVQEFDNIVRPLINLILIYQRHNKTLRQTRDLLLPKLISGKLNVSYLDIDTRKQENDT